MADLPDRPAVPDQTELRLTLLDALSKMAPARRAVIILRYWEDNSVETVAEIMRITPGAVKSLTSRALQDLRSMLGADLPLVTS